MYVHEAINQAIAEDKHITRPNAWWGSRMKIKPTNSPDCCIVISTINKSSAKGWQPKAEDLMADDWSVVN